MKRGTPRHRGFSLLEVLLSLAILVGALAVLGELMGLGVNNVEQARDRSRAAVIAEGIMDQVLAGLIVAQATAQSPVPEELLTYDELNDNWVYTIEMGITPEAGMTALVVKVSQSNAAHFDSTLTEFTLTRWIIEPAIMDEFAAAEEAAASGGTQ